MSPLEWEVAATPRTDAAAFDKTEDCTLEDGTDDVVAASFARALEQENRALRAGCSAIAAALGNGSAASPAASVGFLTEGLAAEVRAYCAALRREQGDLIESLAGVNREAESEIQRLQAALTRRAR